MVPSRITISLVSANPQRGEKKKPRAKNNFFHIQLKTIFKKFKIFSQVIQNYRRNGEV